MTIILKRLILILFIITLFGFHGFSQLEKRILYKQIDTIELYMYGYFPDKIDSTVSYPAIVFFFGGGWERGDIKQFEPHAKYFSRRGAICFLVDYRVNSRHQTSPFESLKDAKTAIRFTRQNALTFNIDTSKVIASGGSAGGHLAASTAVIRGFNEENDDLSVSCIPNALVLFNPVIDNGPGGYGFERIGTKYKNFSPLHNIVRGTPPTIIFIGTEDELIPVETIQYFGKVMERVGSRCELVLFEGEGHGFFNYGRDVNNYRKTVFTTDIFLNSLGHLKGEPLIDIE